MPKTNLSIHLYASDAVDNAVGESGVGSTIRFADVTAPPYWADRITGLVAAISAGSEAWLFWARGCRSVAGRFGRKPSRVLMALLLYSRHDAP